SPAGRRTCGPCGRTAGGGERGGAVETKARAWPQRADHATPAPRSPRSASRIANLGCVPFDVAAPAGELHTVGVPLPELRDEGFLALNVYGRVDRVLPVAGGGRGD